MRILKIKFENINSLKGKWSIDFTAAEYRKNHDIFVIHGPTGSGKTTLLDVITLALYGRTPRLEAINNGEGGNELMTRGTGFCLASVTYSCSRGIFTSTFFQKRAGQKAGGRLQKAEYTLQNENGEVISSGAGSSLEKVTPEYIQLDYAQFCRSILLAQGEFSTFLKSGSRERAEILEKLTGTERYRLIGKKIAARFSEIKKAYQAKKERRDEAFEILLSEEQKKELEAQKEKLEKDLSGIRKEKEALQEEKTRGLEFEKLKASADRARKNKEEARLKLENSAPLEEKLKAAGNASRCESVYSALSSLENEQNHDENEVATLSIGIKAAGESLDAAVRKHELLTASLSGLSSEEESLKKVWKKVRELDLHIKSSSQSLENERLHEAESERNLKNLELSLDELKKELSSSEKQLDSSRKYIEENARDGGLEELLPRCKILNDSISEKRLQLEGKKSELKKLEGDILENRKQGDELKGELSEIEGEIERFLSSDAVFISRLLARNLKEGSPCPVCGVPYRKIPPSCTQGELDFSDEDKAKAEEVSVVSSGLNGRYEDVSSRIKVLDERFLSLSAQKEKLAAAIGEGEKELETREKNFQEELLPWKNLFSGTFDYDVLLSRKEKWASENSRLKEAEISQREKAERIKALEPLIERSAASCKSFDQAVKKLEEEMGALVQEREKLYGKKSPDAEESQFREKLEKMTGEASRALEEKLKFKEACARKEAALAQLKHNISERTPKLEKMQEEFNSRLSASGFRNCVHFLECRLDEEDRRRLEEEIRSVNENHAASCAALETAEKALTDFEASGKILRSQDELNELIEGIASDCEKKENEFVEVKTRLSLDLQKNREYETIMKEFNSLQKEYGIWEQMDKWIGKADGSDLSVFVQSLAFSSLLNLANKNLFGITGRYTIVQKESGSLDFEIKDVYFEDNRSISNLSGGEQFIVSLSLALAISEFASRNVRVDSLFLDEGFGTLSGNLLTESINALKNLRRQSKMLGIITHVQDVIAEIDQKIEVKPGTDGTSTLSGAGITRE